ncbi:MAG: flagellar biosynthesis anti-sigma factor FlgM [Planctomycetaceae bacterium]
MFEQSQTRLNRLALVSYYLDTSVDVGFQQRINITDVLKRRADMDVSGIGSTQGSGPVRSTNSIGATGPAAATPSTQAQSSITSPKDELEISVAGQMLDRLSETPDVRAERLAQIKEAIENGDYDTDEKLEAALERMFDIHGIDLGDE